MELCSSSFRRDLGGIEETELAAMELCSSSHIAAVRMRSERPGRAHSTTMKPLEWR